MICDTLVNCARYQQLHPRFPVAFAWARDMANQQRKDGEYEIQGRDSYAIIQSGRTMPANDKRFESHRRYIDIQINLSGAEVMEWIPSQGLAVAEDFAPDNDIRFHRPLPHAASCLLVRPQEFAIFWPEDAHKPCCHPYGAEVAFRKMVLKVDKRLA